MISIQQAAANAFAAYLRTKIPGVKISSRWPGEQLPEREITVLLAGRRQDIPMDPRILSKVNQGSFQTTAVWQVAACYQPFQLDIWTQSYVARDDLIAQLDIALHAGSSSLTGASTNQDPVGHGCLVRLADGWESMGSTAYFSFRDPDIEDTPISVDRRSFRALYRGGGHMMLAITATTPRQKLIKLSLLLDGSLEESTT